MKRNILILGAGPAGLEAASLLRDMGHNPVIVEKSDSIGGHLRKWDRLFPKKQEAKVLLDELTTKNRNTNLILNSTVESINRLETGGYCAVLSNGEKLSFDGAIISTGFSLFDATRKEEYGYGIYDRVITSADLEELFSKGFGDTLNNPKRVGFVHCVGSRDEKVCNRHCSKVCCVTAVKQATEIKEMFPQSEVFCFYMDLRMFGRGYEDLYFDAQSKYGVRFIRGRVSEVSEDVEGRVVVKAEDTLSSKPIRTTLDLLVLMVGMQSSSDSSELSKVAGLNVGEDGFFEGREGTLHNLESGIDGIYFAGAATGPKTLPETFNEARGATALLNNYLKSLK